MLAQATQTHLVVDFQLAFASGCTFLTRPKEPYQEVSPKRSCRLQNKTVGQGYKCVSPRPPRLVVGFAQTGAAIEYIARVTAGSSVWHVRSGCIEPVGLHTVTVISIVHRPVWYCQTGERVCAGEIALRPPEPINPSRYTPRPVRSVEDPLGFPPGFTARIIPHKPK